MSAPAGRWAVVAGASGGVGAATSRRLAAAGWHVAVLYRSNHAKAAEVADAVRAAGVEAEVFQVDLADAERVGAVVADVAGRGLAGVVYAAGPAIPMEYVSTITPAMVAEQMTTDAVAGFHLVAAALHPLRAAGGGPIVVVGTPAVTRGTVRDVLSTMPKAALEQLVRSVALEEGRYGIRCNMVGVGHLSDGMFDYLRRSGYYTDEYLARAHERIPLRRAGTSDEIAETIEFLMSDRAAYITGQTVNVDGGYSI
ncbi:SDR family NAD(P)-dependent oxidoreductase [Phytohabitans kaempferiae]|uniref:SDR family NAD(P)-dependent oxidoreductase n=1 Tax=Phytohabitans kaempferiae TaxID=1620943 RepID=A0ABV6M528_9ACTN